MSVDEDYLKRILTEAKSAKGCIPLAHFIDADHDRERAGFYVKLAERCGLINAVMISADNDPYFCCDVIGITQKGKEYLDCVAKSFRLS